VPAHGEDEVLLDVAAVSVCGSDVHQWQARNSWPVRHPVVLGHEFCGVVREVGPRSGLRSGDRVVCETHAIVDPDGPLARAGLYSSTRPPGLRATVDGAMRPTMPVPARILHCLPGHVPDEHAALAEPAASRSARCGQHDVKPGDRVVVLGPARSGSSARDGQAPGGRGGARGPRGGRAPSRVAAAYGCLRFRSGSEPLRAWARERDGAGVDGVVDAAGHSAALAEAMGLSAGRLHHEGGLGAAARRRLARPDRPEGGAAAGQLQHNWPMWERVIALLASAPRRRAARRWRLPAPGLEGRLREDGEGRDRQGRSDHAKGVSSMPGPVKTQVSLDLTTIAEALEMARGARRAGIDWLERNALLLGEGLHAVKALRREFPGVPIVADLKTMDGAGLEAEMMLGAGATHVVVMSRAHWASVAEMVKVAHGMGGEVMADVLGARTRRRTHGRCRTLGWTGSSSTPASTSAATSAGLAPRRPRRGRGRGRAARPGGRRALDRAGLETVRRGARSVVIGAPLAIPGRPLRTGDEFEAILRDVVARVRSLEASRP